MMFTLYFCGLHYKDYNKHNCVLTPIIISYLKFECRNDLFAYVRRQDYYRQSSRGSIIAIPLDI